jgi:hypothetical protein
MWIVKWTNKISSKLKEHPPREIHLCSKGHEEILYFCGARGSVVG